MKITEEFKEFYGGKKILCAVSGGVDSMCLLHVMHASGIDIVAAHYEHGIRGAESLRDAFFVQSYCESMGIPFVLGRGNVPAYAKANGMCLEEAARELRYEFLEGKRVELGCDLIATAHNADDNAETLLMNLIRGSGAKGLSGIPHRRGKIVRPLIARSRQQIAHYMADLSIPHVEDSTNARLDYTRNIVRHKLMPLIQELNPNFVDAAARTTELMSRDEEALDSLARAILPKILDADDNSIDIETLEQTHIAISSRILRRILGNIPMDSIGDVMHFARESGYGELCVPGHSITRDMGRLYFDLKWPTPLPERPFIPGKTLPLPEAELVLTSEIVEYNGEVNDLFTTSYIKYEIIGTDIHVGPRRDGDRMRPLGRGVTKKLKTLFMEEGIPVHQRDIYPVIRDENGILLVGGIAIDERAVPQPGDKALKISFEEI